MPLNRAAFLTAIGTPLSVQESPYKSPGPGQVTIKNCALAINPCDPGIQDSGLFIKDWPTVLGEDVAGVVEEVGPGVTVVKTGDRVLGSSQSVFGPQESCGFQLYTVLDVDVVTKLPDSMSFESGCVLPLAISTAASGLYNPEFLGLEYPSMQPKDQGTYVFVWGGSSSVGSTAVQLAVNSGYRVITTSSPKNTTYCEMLGAERVFDHNVASIVEDITNYLTDKELAGSFDAISAHGTVEKMAEIVKNSRGSKNIATVQPGTDQGHSKDLRVTAVMKHLKTAGLAAKIFVDFLPTALEAGQMKAKPDPLVVGTGLESLQGAFDKLKAGVSATKIVVSVYNEGE